MVVPFTCNISVLVLKFPKDDIISTATFFKQTVLGFWKTAFYILLYMWEVNDSKTIIQNS